MALITDLMPDSVPDPPVGRTYTPVELGDDVPGIMAEIHRSGPASVTRNGRFVAAIIPLDDRKMIHATLTTEPFATEVHKRIAGGDSDA